MNQKTILVSGIQPTNKLTLGNYLGAIKNYVKLQHQYESYLFVADYHLLTTNFNPEVIKSNSLEIIKYYLACGIDPKICKFFYQSAIREHLELCYLLLTHTSLGELNRMTQFKDKSQLVKLNNQTTTIPTGLLIYPILMAADILIYDANLVPVGQDQKQHLELARNIAIRINNKYHTSIFTVPKEYIAPVAARVMDLQNPLIKMSKSNHNDKGTIFLNDPIPIAQQKIMQAKTDSLNQINYDWTQQPGISNLIQIYCAIKDVAIDHYVQTMANETYAKLKQDVANVVGELLMEIQTNYDLIKTDDLDAILTKNKIICQKIAKAKVDAIHKLFGLI